MNRSGGINNNIDIGIEVLIFYQFPPSVSDAFVWPCSLKQMKVAISSHMGTRWTENEDEGSRHGHMMRRSNIIGIIDRLRR